MKLKSTQQKIWFTSDLHIGHKSILNFCQNRVQKYGTGNNVEEMNKRIIADWNKTVSEEDIVFILGDVSFTSVQDTANYLSQLNGKLHLISGNHDVKYLDKKLFTVWFETVQHYLEIQVDNQKICMFHFPIIEWASCHYGSWHLHGHTHGKALPIHEYKSLDVGIDNTQKTVIEFKEIEEIMSNKKILKHGSSENGNVT